MNDSSGRTDADPDRPWRGSELFERDDWEWVLTVEERDEVAAAAEGLEARSDPGAARELSPSDFPLPTLAPRLASIGEALERGPGACLVRGLPAAVGAAAACIFRGVASHLGRPVPQNPRGDRLLDVRDEGFAPSDPRFRGPHSNLGLSFHTDRCDVIAFYCIRPALEGGANELVSARALGDELRARYPDHWRTLQEPVPYLRHTMDAANPRPFTMVPVFTEWEGHFAASYLRVLIDRADRSPDAPNLTEAQRAALDALDEVAREPGMSAGLRLGPGDLLLVNNWVTFHRRASFVDHTDPAQRRHLLRLWLSVPGSRPLDPRFEDHFGATAAGALRGGILGPG